MSARALYRPQYDNRHEERAVHHFDLDQEGWKENIPLSGKPSETSN